MNTPQKIDELLERYWEGETSLEEERALKRYFESADIAERHLPVAPLFSALSLEQKVRRPEPRPKPVTLRTVFFRNRRLLAAAAVALVAAVAYFQWRRQPLPDTAPLSASLSPQPLPAPDLHAPGTHRDSLALKPAALPRAKRKKARRLNDPALERSAVAARSPEEIEAEQAYAQVKAALEMIALKLNKSKEPLAEALQNTSRLEPFFSQMDDDDN